MLTKKDIETFIQQTNYDVRISGNGRWFDQKCTPDVIQVIASAIINYCTENNFKAFTSKEIWNSDFSKHEIREIFKKPGTDEYTSKNEYDKFFSQPIKFFAYAGILSESKKGILNFYTIKQYDLLEAISISERFTLDFITIYLEKVLRDSDLFKYFERFFENQSIENFELVKNKFIDFEIQYTLIKKETEPKRIFTKVINPLAYKRSAKGTSRGRISKDLITKDELMYNRYNFRDIYTEKPKSIARTEHSTQPKTNLALFKFQSEQAKKRVRKFNQEYENGISQYRKKQVENEKATQMHHIFPAATYPEISGYTENLIALTPNEHYLEAHTHNKTSIVDVDYQKKYLLSKVEDIEKYNKTLGESSIYSYENFLEVLANGFGNAKILNIHEDYYGNIVREINSYYEVKQ